MELHFTTIHDQSPGVLASLLKRSYAALVAADPVHWGPETPRWEQFDREAFANPGTVGACVFLSWLGDELVGFGSYDPRQRPVYGIVGHNCVLPEFRGKGLGKRQIREILRRFRSMGMQAARVSTNDHALFLPAQRMYIACGFRETGRRPWPGDPSQAVIEYAMDLRQPAG